MWGVTGRFEVWSVGPADLDSYAVTLQDAAVLLRTKGREAAEAALEPMARQMWMGRVRSARGTKPEEAQGQPGKASDSDRAFVFLRDGFQCRLCGGRCVPRNVLVAFHHVFPDLIVKQSFSVAPVGRTPGCIW